MIEAPVNNQNAFARLLAIRFRWFVHEAAEFIRRNQMGLLVVLLFLPGVAVLDNLLIFYRFLATPFLQAADLTADVWHRIIAWVVVALLSLGWARKQQRAIRGGDFGLYLNALPFSRQKLILVDGLMLLLANHLWWVLLLSPLILQWLPDQSPARAGVAGSFLLPVSVVLAQWLSVLSASARSRLAWALGTLCFLLVTRWFPVIGSLTAVLFYGLAAVLLLRPRSSLGSHHTTAVWQVDRHMPFWLSWYVQVLLRSHISGTYMRVGLCLFLLLLGGQLRAHFMQLNDGNAVPYYLVMTAGWVYWLSGLFTQFDDERKRYSEVLQPLPFARFYWMIRDYAVVAFFSVILYIPAVLMVPEISLLSQFLGYQLVMLLLVYPVRCSGHSHQPFTAFLLLLVATVLWITW